MNLKDLTNEELLTFAAEANSTNDQKLVNEITDELKRRNIVDEILNDKDN